MSGEFDLNDLRSCIASCLHIPAGDAELIDVVLAVYKSNEIPGDPLWIIVIDSSGGGKTEILRPLRPLANAYFLSALTEKTLISGYRDPRNPSHDPSLLPKIDGKVLVIKDLSPLLSMRRESRNAILADLRDAYDGFTDQGRGNLGCINYKAHFSLVAAATLAIERFDAIDGELGERSVKFRMRYGETYQKVEQAIRNTGKDGDMRELIECLVSSFINGLPVAPQSPEVPEALLPSLASIADFTATARSHVPRDKSHKLEYQPRPEVGTRLGKQLAKLLMTLSFIRGKPAAGMEELQTVVRVAEDCLPPNRLLVLRELACTDGLRTSEVAERTRLPWSTAKLVLEDLHILRIVERTSLALLGEPLWKIAEQWRQQLENIPILMPL